MNCRIARWLAIVALVGALATATTAQEPDWGSMSYTAHQDYQAVNGDGQGTFPTTSPIKMKGVILNRPSDMLNPTPGFDPFMGGQWQQFIQSVDEGDFGGTAMYMGQNIGKIVGNHPAGSYTDAEWLAELDRLNHDPITGRAFRSGDLVEVRARAPGLFFRGKTNINEQHQKTPLANFDIVLLQANYLSPAPQTITLADVKDSADQFIFDQSRATGAEHYQATFVRFENVQFIAGTWGRNQSMTIADGTGRTLPVLLGFGNGFAEYPAPTGSFDIVGIFDQEDKVSSDGWKNGYRLWVMDYDGNQFVLYRYVKPDFDRDGDVDETDLDYFETCASGPGIHQADSACLIADFDQDDDVDQGDFSLLQRCFSGSLELPDPNCDR
ncbi:MAG: hypothetical protein ACUVXJ_02810 [Phycisphaerae bacterium]